MISQRDKKLLVQLADNTCENCHKDFNLEDLEIHRIRREWEGGTYHFRNCQVLCKKCHKTFHRGEFPHISNSP